MVETIRSLMRPFITVSLIVMVAYGVYVGKIDTKDILNFAGIVIGFYFGERGAKHALADANGTGSRPSVPPA